MQKKMWKVIFRRFCKEKVFLILPVFTVILHAQKSRPSFVRNGITVHLTRNINIWMIIYLEPVYASRLQASGAFTRWKILIAACHRNNNRERLTAIHKKFCESNFRTEFNGRETNNNVMNFFPRCFRLISLSNSFLSFIKKNYRLLSVAIRLKAKQILPTMFAMMSFFLIFMILLHSRKQMFISLLLFTP